MKITPIHENKINIEVGSIIFTVCTLTEGGIQVLDKDGCKLRVNQREMSVVIHTAPK